MNANLDYPYRVKWGACALAIGVSNLVVGAALGLMYGLQSFGFNWASIHASGNDVAVWRAVIVSAAFGAIFPTALSLLLMIPNRSRSRSWPVAVAAGPAVFSLLSFVFVWSFPLVLAFVGLAAMGGGLLGVFAVGLVGGVRPVSDDG